MKEVPEPQKEIFPRTWDGSIATIVMLLEKLRNTSPTDHAQYHANLMLAISNLRIPHDVHDIVVRSIRKIVCNCIAGAELGAASVLNDCVERFSKRESDLQEGGIEASQTNPDDDSKLGYDPLVSC